MVDYAADDAAEIAKRLKEIAAEEAPLANSNVDTAIGRDLRILANLHGVKWTEDESDYAIRPRIKAKL